MEGHSQTFVDRIDTAELKGGSRIAAFCWVLALHGAVIFILMHQFSRLVPLAASALTVTLEPAQPRTEDKIPPAVRLVPVPRMVITPPEIKIQVDQRPPPRSEIAITLPPPPPSTTSRILDPNSDYVSQLAAQLNAVKRYPIAALALRREGTILVAFTLDRSGNVIAWHIVRSSSVAVLDQEVSEMMRLATPFPPFPKTMDKAQADFIVPISFALSDANRRS